MKRKNAFRRFMRGRTLILLALMCISPDVSLGQALTPFVFDMNELRGSPHPNLLAPSSAAFDAWRNILYAHSTDFDHVAVLEIHTGRRRNSIILPDSLRGRLELLHAHDRTGVLAVSISDPAGNGRTIAALDPLTGAVLPAFRAAFEGAPQLISHPDANLVFMSTGRRHILLLNGDSMRPVDSIDAGIPVSSLSLDSLHAALYAGQYVPTGGQIRVRAFSTLNGQMIKSFVYGADAAAVRIAVDWISQSFALLTDAGLRLYDEFGIFIRDFPTGTGARAAASSVLSQRLLFLSSTAYDEEDAGRRGKLYSFSFRTGNLDSTVVGMDASAVFVSRPDNDIAVVNTGSSSVDVLYVPGMLKKRVFELGHSVEGLACAADGSTIFVANARGAGGVTAVDAASRRTRRIPTGMRTVSLARDDRRERIAAFDHASNMIRFISTAPLAVDDSLQSGTLPGCRTDAFASLSLSSAGDAAAAYPEHAQLTVFNLDGSGTLRNEPLDGYDYGGEKGAGLIQTVFTPDASFVAVLLYRQRRLQIFRTERPGLLRQIDLENVDWTRVTTFPANCLRPGLAPGEVFAGPFRIDCNTGAVDSLRVEGALLVLGTAASGHHLALRADGDTLALLKAGNPAFEDAAVVPLAASVRAPDAVRFDAASRSLLLGYSRPGRVLLYRLDDVLRSEPHLQAPDRIIPYPSPLRAGAPLLRIAWPGPETGRIREAALYSMSGARIRALPFETDDPGSLTLRLVGVGPGLYGLLLRSDARLLMLRITVIP